MEGRATHTVVPTPSEAAPFALAALIGLASMLLPGPDVDLGIALAGVGLTLVAIAAGVLLPRLPAQDVLVGAIPLVYLCAVVLLRHAINGVAPGISALFLLAIAWLALFGTSRQLLLGLGALAASFLVPYALYGEPRYPSSSLRTTLIFLTVGAVIGTVIQGLVTRTRAARDRLGGIMRATTATAIIGVDLQGTITSFNTGAERMLGYTADEVVGRETPGIFHDPAEVAERAAELGVEPGFGVFVGEARAGRSETRVWRHRRKDGAWLHVSLTVTAERDETGAIVGFLGIATDISERFRAREELMQTTTRLQGVLDHTPATISLRDRDGRYLLVNRCWEEVYGCTHDEAVGRTAPELFEDEAGDDSPRRSVLDTGEVVSHQRVRPGPQGMRTHAVIEFPLRRDDGWIYATGAVASDVTERQQALDAAMEASRAKSEFLANMSHEIRTPLNGVIGMLELLKDTGLSPDQAEYVRTAESSGDALLGVINDILDFSKIEAGRLELDAHEFDLRRIVEDTADIFATPAHAKGLELAYWIDDDVPVAVHGDGNRLRQVLTNLLANAVKFTEEGQVTLHVRRDAAAEDGVGVRFEVADTGIGIAPEVAEALFEPFAQADVSTTRRFGGTGLGLAISRQLVTMMGGALTVRSAPGEGSTFSFTTRLGVADPDGPRFTRAPFPESVRVLAVDDNTTNRAIVEAYLVGAGARCDLAISGSDALVLLEAAARAGEPYELVVVDHQMPGMDGTELVRRIRDRPSLRSARLLMLTSGSAGHAAAREAGVDRHLDKPVRRARLLEVAAGLLAGAPAPATEPAPAAAPVASRGRVLVAEDNAVNQMVIVTMLERRGIEADVAPNGAVALELFDPARHAAVLMDCQMPVLDGYAATGQLRASEGPDLHVPVIAMTAHAMPGDRELCLAAGMDDYMAKPIRPDVLDAVLDRWLGAAPPAPPPLDATLVDAARIRSFVEDFPGMAEGLAKLFGEVTPPLLGDLQAAVEEGDPDTVQRLVHELKGSAQNMGATAIAETCDAVERGTLAPAAAVDRLDGLLSRTLRAIDEAIAAAAETRTSS